MQTRKKSQPGNLTNLFDFVCAKEKHLQMSLCADYPGPESEPESEHCDEGEFYQRVTLM